MMNLVQDSREKWLKNIPAEWSVIRVKNIFKLSKEKNKGEIIDVLSLTQQGIKVRDITDNDGQIAESYDSYTRVRPGDIVFNPMDLRSGSVDLSKFDGVISLAYTIIRKKPNVNINLKYYSYYFYWHYLQQILFPYGKGVSTDHRWTLQDDILMNFPVLCPKKEDQNTMSELLDKKTVLIDQIIEKKQKLIGLLQEKRSALITHAVTKGLDPKAKMKPSGIDWIDTIPSNWTLNKMKYLGEVIIGLTYSPEDVTNEEGTLVLRSSNIKDGHILLNDNVYVTKEIPKKLITKIGDVLICSRNGSAKLVGKCAYIEKDGLNVTFGAFMTIFRSKFGKYISSFLESNLFLSQLTTVSTSTINQLTTEYLNNVLIPTPPVNEQIEIIKAIETKTKQIDKIISDVDTQIKHLQEYRLSLIYHAVTGKIKI